MSRYLVRSLLLLLFTVVIICVIYPLVLLVIGRTVFPFQASGSLVRGPDGNIVGSRLIAQSFTKDEYFHPRPSAAAYDASASAASCLAASNYVLRDRVARSLGPIVRYRTGPRAGQLVAPDIVEWFRRDTFQGQPHVVAQWAALHPELASGWTDADSGNADRIEQTFFDLWRQDHPQADLQDVPADMVTASGSGLDPHITLLNAECQLDRVAAAWAGRLGRDSLAVRNEIHHLLLAQATAPFSGLAGERLVNVLSVNLELCRRYEKP